MNHCIGKQDGTFFPVPEDRKKFIECIAETEEIYECPDDTYWNEEEETCVNVEIINAENIQ